MEHHRGYTIVLTEFGTFHKAKPLNDVEVGMESHYELLPERKGSAGFFLLKKQHAKLRILAMATAILLAFLPLYSWYDSNKAYAYVNVDINPSVELEINEDRQVLNMIPHNEDAAKLLDEFSSWKHKTAEEVIVRFVELSEKQGMMNELDSVLVGVSYLNEELEFDFTEEIEDYVDEQLATLSVAAFVVPESIRTKAKEVNKPVNQYMAETISADSSTVQDEDVSTSEVQQLDGEDKDIIQSFYKSEEPKDPVEKKEEGSKNKPVKTEKAKQTTPPGQEKQDRGQKSSPVEKKNDHPGQGKGLEKEKPEKNTNEKKDNHTKGNEPSSKANDKVKEKQAPGQEKKKGHSPSGGDKKKNKNSSKESGQYKTPPGHMKKDTGKEKQAPGHKKRDSNKDKQPPGQSKKENKK